MSLIIRLRRKLGGISCVIRREWFLSTLIVMYLVLTIVDRGYPRKSLRLVDWESLALITALIITSKGLELSGIFTRLAIKLITLSRGSERKLVMILLPIIAFSSALIMNDTAILIFTPLVVVTGRIAGIDVPRSVALSAIAANVGSSLTPIGNPQNVIIWKHYSLSFLGFIKGMLPYVLLWLVILFLFSLMVKDRRFGVKVPPVEVDVKLFLLSSFLLVFNVVMGRVDLAKYSLLFTVLVYLIFRRDVLLSFDVALVPTFALIFANFSELSSMINIGKLTSAGAFLYSLILSQIISNVPATVVMLPWTKNWLYLSLGVNLGGTGSMVGSLANLIAIRLSGISVKEFHRYSLAYLIVALLLTLFLLGIRI
ncbi:SLC13 family permease [Pyrococcus kukulkanii]|uniref:SLC13 family permease n=2 Tax=Pyrococcus kukulkanii TaxID=1609559 RepID=A0ABV4T3T7_9EURY